MKKLKFILSFVFILFASLALTNVKASSLSDFTSRDLMYLEVNGVGRIIKPETTIEEIAGWYGNSIKLETDSLFGGKAYSFYYGNNYDDYLYIETIADGRIFSYGSVDPSYKTNTYSFGDKYPYNERNALYGCLLSDDGIIVGGIYYNKSIYLNGSSSKIIKAYRDRFEEEYCRANNLSNSSEIGSDKDTKIQSKVMLDLSKHAALMYNGLINYYGRPESFMQTDRDANGVDTFTTLENYFYINNQFLEFKTSLFSYLVNMGYGSSYYNSLGAKSNCDLAYSTYYVFNPLQLAGMAKLQKNKDLSTRNIPVWSYNYADKILVGISFSPNCFERADEVTLTTDEQNKLSAGRGFYNEAMAKLNESSDIYKIQPILNPPGNMRAGELTDAKKEGMLLYFNSIRAAAGLGTLRADADGFDIAQHLTTLLAYRFRYLGLGLTHFPEQPAGVSTEYWKRAVGWETSWGNSLSYASRSVSSANMIYHINNLLYDNDGSIDYGHRRHLLHPGYSLFGYGITEFFAEVNLNGYQQYDYVCNGWPAPNGVTFLESLAHRKFNWSVAFDKTKYLVLNSTKAEVKCLNTGDTVYFNSEVNNTTQLYENVVEGENIDSLINKIVMYDSSIDPMAGYVYQVTIKGIKNVRTNKIENYTYRVVFDYADENRYPTTSNTLKIDTSNLYKMPNYVAVYQAPIGRSLKLKLTMSDESVIDKKVTWSSSKPDVISVTQDGTIYASKPSEEQVIISVKFDGSNITDQIILMPYISLESVQLDPESAEINLEEEQAFYIQTVPEDVKEILNIEWVLSDGNHEYYLTKTPDNSRYGGKLIFQLENDMDSNLADYFDVTSVIEESGVKRGITLKVVGINNTVASYKLKTYVVAMSDMYREERFGGASDIIASSKITSVESYINYDGNNVKIENSKYSLVVKGNGPYRYKLSAKSYPENATEINSNLSWKIKSGNAAKIVNGDTLEVTKPGTVVVSRGGAKPEDITFTITAPISKINTTVNLTNTETDANGNKVYVKPYSGTDSNTQEIEISKVPSIATAGVNFEVVQGKNYATVDKNGLVKFGNASGNIGDGKFSVKITSKENSNVYTYVYFRLEPTISNLRFTYEDGGPACEVLNVDFAKFQPHLPENVIEVDGYQISYDLPTGSSSTSYVHPIVKYSIDGIVDKVHDGKGELRDRVTIDENTGMLYISGAITPEMQIKVKAEVTNIADINPLEYTLIVNKESDINRIDITTKNDASFIQDGNIKTFFLSKDATYHFSPVGDDTSNDVIKLAKNGRDTSTSDGNISYVVNDDEFIVTTKGVGEYELSVKVNTYKNSIVTENPKKPGTSIKSNVSTATSPTNTKVLTFRIVVTDYQKGDVNKDGYVNAIDAALVLDFYKNNNATDEDYRLGDMDNNGMLNAADAAAILDIFKNH